MGLVWLLLTLLLSSVLEIQSAANADFTTSTRRLGKNFSYPKGKD